MRSGCNLHEKKKHKNCEYSQNAYKYVEFEQMRPDANSTKFLLCNAMCRRQNVIIIDKWAAAKLSAIVKKHCNPWPFVGTCILSANNSLLILITIFGAAIISDVTLYDRRWCCRCGWFWCRRMCWQWWWPWVSGRFSCCLCCKNYRRFGWCLQWADTAWPWSRYSWMCGCRMIWRMSWNWRRPFVGIRFFVICNKIYAVRWL